VIPSFVSRVDRPDRGGDWVTHLRERRERTEAAVARLGLDRRGGETAPSVDLLRVDGTEDDLLAATLFESAGTSEAAIRHRIGALDPIERAELIGSLVGERRNRRHKPGRAFERTTYRFDVLTDYGAFRDLQRHRLLTLEWQPLTTRHGFTEPEAIREAGAGDDWDRVMDASAALHDAMIAAGMTAAAQYGVAMAYRVRFYMEMNAREAMHLIELRTAPQGHPAYRRVCQQMHRLIAERAGHRAVAAAMTFADHSVVELERLGSERNLEKKRTEAG